MQYIALLRAINVGGHNVKMPRLVELFEQLHFSQVSTFIASGNVIFHSDDNDVATLEARIEAHLLQGLGYETPTFIRTVEELHHVTLCNPFRVLDGQTLHVAFLKSEFNSTQLETIHGLQTVNDDLQVLGRELYWLCKIPTHESKLSNSSLEKKTKTWMTMRNIKTVNNLLEKYGA
jgi:uncharacterized protein (DUF1697 family)